MTPLLEYAREIAEAVIHNKRPLALTPGASPYAASSLRVAFSQLKVPVQTTMDAMGTLTIIPKPAARPNISEMLKNAEDDGGNRRLANHIETKQHSLPILAAMKLLLDYGIIESVRLLNMSEEDFKMKYPQESELFEIYEVTNGIILL